MPISSQRIVTVLILSCFFVVTMTSGLAAKGIQEMRIYYIRLDVKSSDNRITGSKLTMVPAENDFRQANFSRFPISHLITAAPQESLKRLESLAKKKAFSLILEQYGLKSVNTLNGETVLSYEGIIQTPVSLSIAPYNEALGGFPYLADLYFAPLAFPDNWESLKQQFKIKKFFHDFILLFK